ncbi:CHAD domain-containing protein [Gordonia sp. OPL2]|uniref:CYTH and CHAD domain-containing protein n=1 Tax=Gordonia sp. OPL2 TaxID=2486274 RepID=UPI00165626E1|nr:CHAD domain-containing protein [Gordonia sp. OPL2]
MNTRQNVTTWDVPLEIRVPSVDDDAERGLEATPESSEFTDTFFDTAELDLVRHGVTLRHTDDGGRRWLAEFTSSTMSPTIELDGSGDDTDVPEEIADLLWGLRLGKELRVAAIVHTRRTRHHHTDRNDRPRLDVIDDVVSATVPGPVATATRWREVIVEPIGKSGDRVAGRIHRRLHGAGARRSATTSRLTRALGHDAESGAESRRPSSRSRTAVESYIAVQLAAIFAGDIALRRGEEPIHDTRVAIRRLRSTLRTSKAILDTARIEGVDEELKWFAGLLGEVRDRHVQGRRFRESVAALPEELVLGPVAARIDEILLGEQTDHRRTVDEAMTSDRYRDLLAVLGMWTDTPPLAADSRIRTDDLRTIVRRGARKADKRLAAAITTGEPTDLHRARKAAKRARYAAELARPVLDKRHGKARVKRFKRIQTVLGDHQDATIAAESLRRLGAGAGVRGGENGFTYGILYQREIQAAQDARRRVAHL